MYIKLYILTQHVSGMLCTLTLSVLHVSVRSTEPLPSAWALGLQALSKYP